MRAATRKVFRLRADEPEYALANAELPLDALRAIALDDEDGPVNLFHITCAKSPFA